jgi:hypothetical protein
MSDNEKPVTAVIPVGMGERGVALHNIDEAWRFCDAIQKSGVAPKGMNDTAKIFAVVQAGAELGLTPFRALSNMKIINGRVGPMGSLAKALVRSARVLAPGTGFKEDFVGEEDTDEWAARIVTLRDGESKEYITTFSVKDAKLAGLWGKRGREGAPTPWVTYPKRMLMWRAIGFHMDDYYSDVLMGMHLAEILEDYPEERVPVVMEHRAVTVKDPLLESLTPERELEEIAAELQPPITPEGEVLLQLPEGMEVSPQEIANAIDKAGLENAAYYLIDHHESAMNSGESIQKAAEAVKDEDLAEPDPNNAAGEGVEPELPL